MLKKLAPTRVIMEAIIIRRRRNLKMKRKKDFLQAIKIALRLIILSRLNRLSKISLQCLAFLGRQCDQSESN